MRLGEREEAPARMRSWCKTVDARGRRREAEQAVMACYAAVMASLD
jgi:hypothetical protein